MWSVFRRPVAYAARPLSVGDASACAVLHRAAFPRGWSVAEFETLIVAQNTRGDGRFAVDSDELLAFVLSRIAADEAEILTIATTKLVQRKGLAGDLLKDHIETLQRAGMRKLFLDVAADNIAALALYRKFGFVKVGERPAYYCRFDSGVTVAYVMGLEL